MSAVRKIEVRRRRDRAQAKHLISEIASGKEYIVEEYLQLFGLFCSNNAALEDIKPLFRIPGIDPEGCFSVDEYFNSSVKSIAAEVLKRLPY
jgi:hypothetical protein